MTGCNAVQHEVLGCRLYVSTASCCAYACYAEFLTRVCSQVLACTLCLRVIESERARPILSHALLVVCAEMVIRMSLGSSTIAAVSCAIDWKKVQLRIVWLPGD